MRKTLALALLAAALAVPAWSETYGGGVKLAETTSIAKILAEPGAFAGERVRVEGLVSEVCPRAGCWMMVREDDSGSALRVKVEDGVIVFPMSAKGKTAVVEGTVEVLPQTREEWIAHLAHLAEERGETFDPESVGKGPFHLVQIRGLGAEIQAPAEPKIEDR